jgi:hypothetical protein
MFSLCIKIFHDNLKEIFLKIGIFRKQPNGFKYFSCSVLEQPIEKANNFTKFPQLALFQKEACPESQ